MNNIRQKNVMYGNDKLSKLPYQNSETLKLKQGQNLNSIRFDNITKQLVNNDIFLEQRENAKNCFVAGPKEDSALQNRPNGYKAFRDNIQSDLSIIHKENMSLQETFERVTNFNQEEYVGDQNFADVFRYGDYTIALGENSVYAKRDDEEEYYKVPFSNGIETVNVNCQYHDDYLVLIGTEVGIFKIDFPVEGRIGSTIQCTYINKDFQKDVTAIGYNKTRGEILVGTRYGVVYKGIKKEGSSDYNLSILGEFDDNQYLSNQEDGNIINPGRIVDFLALNTDDYIKGGENILVGTQDGLFRSKSTRQLINKQVAELSSKVEDTSEIQAIFQLNDDVHILSENGLYNTGLDMSTIKEFVDKDGKSISAIQGTQSLENSQLLWKGNEIYEYYFSSSDNSYHIETIFQTSQVIKCANQITIQNEKFLIVSYVVAEGKKPDIVLYRRSDLMSIENIGNDEAFSNGTISQIMVQQSNNQLYMLCEDDGKLYRITINSLQEYTVKRIDNLKRIIEGSHSRIVVVQDEYGKNREVYVQDNKTIIRTSDNSLSVKVLETEETITDFDGCVYEYSDSYGTRKNKDIVYMTGSGIFRMYLDGTNRTQKLASLESSDTPHSVIHSGLYFVASAGKKLFTFDMSNGFHCKQYETSAPYELHNEENDNSKIYALNRTSKELKVLEIKNSLKVNKTEVSGLGRKFFSDNINPEIFATGDNGLSVYVTYGTSCQMSAIVDTESKSNYAQMFGEMSYVNCNDNGVYIRDLSSTRCILSTPGTMVATGAYYSGDDLYGAFSICDGISSLNYGTRQEQRIVQDNQDNHMLYFVPKKRNREMVTIGGNQISVSNYNTTATTKYSKTLSYQGNMVNMMTTGTTNCIVTDCSVYTYDDTTVLTAATLTATRLDLSGQIRCASTYNHALMASTTTINRYQLFVVGSNIYYTNGVTASTTANVLFDGECYMYGNTNSIAVYGGSYRNNTEYSDGTIVANDGRTIYVLDVHYNNKDKKFSTSDSIKYDVITVEDGMVENAILYNDQILYSVRYQDGSMKLFHGKTEFDVSSIDKFNLGLSVTGFSTNNINGLQPFMIMLSDGYVYTDNKLMKIDAENRTPFYNFGTGTQKVNNDIRTVLATSTGIIDTQIVNYEFSEVPKVIIESGEPVDIKGVKNMRPMTVDADNIMVVLIQGIPYYTSSKYITSKSVFKKVIPDSQEQFDELWTNGRTLYLVNHNTTTENYKILTFIAQNNGGVYRFIQTRNCDIEDKYKVASSNEVNLLFGVDIGTYQDLFMIDEEENIYSVDYAYGFIDNDQIFKTGIKYACWCNDEDSQSTYKRRCYFLKEDNKIVWYQGDGTEHVEYTDSNNVYSFKVSKDTLFIIYKEEHEGTSSYTAKWMQSGGDAQEFLFSDSNINCVEWNGARFLYTFHGPSTGLWANTETDYRKFDRTECKKMETEGAEIGEIVQTRVGNSCGLITKDEKYLYNIKSDSEIAEKVTTGLEQFESIRPIFSSGGNTDGRYIIGNESYEGYYMYSNAETSKLPRFERDDEHNVGVAYSFGNTTAIIIGNAWITFDGITPNGCVFRRIGTGGIIVNQTFQIDSQKFLMATSDGQYYLKLRKGTFSIPTPVTTSTTPMKQVFKVVENNSTYYVSVKSDGMYTSQNCLVWTRVLDIDISQIGFNKACFVTSGRFIVATRLGLYQTNPYYRIRDDFYRFTERNMFDLYSSMSETIQEKIDTLSVQHMNEAEYGHDDKGIIAKIEELDDVSMNEFNEQISSWNEISTSIDNSLTSVTNDIVREVQFGTQDDGEIAVNCSNFLVSSDNCDFSYIAKRWTSGLTEIYLYIPTTNTYYINHIEGVPNCNYYNTNMIRKNLQRFGTQKATLKGDMSKCYTSFNILLDNTTYNIDGLLGIEANGNSLPLKIYKDTQQQTIEGQAALMYHSFVEPTIGTGYQINNGQGQSTDHVFKFACFGTDSQAVRITFMDENSRNMTKRFKLVFNSNGTSQKTYKQVIPLDENRTVYLKRSRFTWGNTQKVFGGWSFTPNPETDSVPDLQDNQIFGYSTKYIPKSIMNTIKNGSVINLYAVWYSNVEENEMTTFTLRSDKSTFGFEGVTIDSTTKLGDIVRVNYEEKL